MHIILFGTLMHNERLTILFRYLLLRLIQLLWKTQKVLLKFRVQILSSNIISYYIYKIK